MMCDFTKFFANLLNFVWFHEFFRLQHPIQHFLMDLQFFGAGYHTLSVEMKIVNYLSLVRNDGNRFLIFFSWKYFSVKSEFIFLQENVLNWLKVYLLLVKIQIPGKKWKKKSLKGPQPITDGLNFWYFQKVQPLTGKKCKQWFHEVFFVKSYWFFFSSGKHWWHSNQVLFYRVNLYNQSYSGTIFSH